MKVAVAGLGLMGANIALEYALGGHVVWGIARNPEAAASRLDAVAELAVRANVATIDEALAARDSIAISELLSVEPVDLFIESIVEDVEAKEILLREAAICHPGAIMASNTSSISISELGRRSVAPDRMLGTHYWNPPLLMPLVELIAGEGTEPKHVDTMETVLRELGKQPVRVDRDVDGFVWNRLQLALVREAVWLAENGVASPAAIDRIVRDGLARRWRFSGPFETMALGGADTFTRIAARLFPVLSDATSLENLDRWLEHNEASLNATKHRRDLGLIGELEMERSSTPDDTI